MSINSYWPDSQSWERNWMPNIVAGIAVIQLLISFVILGLQCGIIIIGIALCFNPTGIFIVGFIAWAFFLSCWISTFCVTCCNRSSVGCATYVLVKNVLAFIFSAILMSFDNDFFAKGDFDYSFRQDCFRSSYNVDTSKSTKVLISLTKAQLACAVIILVASLAYVGIYIYVYIRSIQNGGRISNANFPIRDQAPVMYTTSYQTVQPNQMSEQQRPSWKVQQASGVIPNALNSSGGTSTVVCHKCGATVNISPTHF